MEQIYDPNDPKNQVGVYKAKIRFIPTTIWVDPAEKKRSERKLKLERILK